MSNPSNLYAEKIFSEHPLVLWALDDQADYVSLITEAQRNIAEPTALWDGTGGGTTPMSTPATAPFQDSATSIIYADIPATNGAETIAWSPDLVNFLSLDSSLETVSVGTYFYSNSIYVQSISIGIEYTDPSTSQVVRQFETFDSPIYATWSFISGTFTVPNVNASFRVLLKFTTLTGGATTDDYQIFFNGISAGQWSEEFHAFSLGVQTIAFPNTVAIDGNRAIEAQAYGLGDKSGYYLSGLTSLFAKNTSIPLVYGASGLTKIVPNSDNPSLIIPGQGFLNEAGRHKEYTVEFWARINSDATLPKRIFGPIASSDGLYVESGFLTLKIDKSFKSHFVGEWYRPMLINIRLVKDSATLLVNGEEVLSISFDTKTIPLPSILNDPSGKEQDWLGFYAYNDVPEIEIDCVAIYPYQVPVTMAKRRWVYGQGVESPEGINSAYGGTSSFIDYTFADYTANYSYPSFAKWQQASFDNLFASRTSLQTPTYTLPQISIGSKTTEDLYNDNQAVQVGLNNFITFRPNETWATTPAYFNFPQFSILSDEIHAIYAVVQINDNDITQQTIIEIKNTINGNRFSIRKDGSNIDYYLKYNGVEEEILIGQEFPLGIKFAVGINIENLVAEFGGNVASFFGNRNGLTVYFGGDDSAQKTFTGYMYSLGFCTLFNKTQIVDHFLSDGTANINAGDELLSHTASYTLLPLEAYDNFYLDIGVSGYWEDYMPLSYFAQYVKNDIGNEYYDLDFLQFNVDYPLPSKITQTQVGIESFSYAELDAIYSSPTQQTYTDLANQGAEGWLDYLDMAQASISAYAYDTAGASIKSYITFQYIDEGANSPQSYFPKLDKPLASRILDIDDHTQWLTTKFEVVDNTLIYPTKTIDFNKLAIVYSLEFNIRGSLTKPITLRNLSLSSQVFNNNSFNPVGTKFGTQVYPYKKSGLYYDYKTKNPYTIYKGSTPYLYMTRSSGIEVRGTFDQSIDRGISMPVNSSLADNYRVSAFQTWYRNDNSKFESTPTQFFEIKHKNEIIKFYVQSVNTAGSRAKIFAINDSTGEATTGISYYINGSIVREPVLTIKEWSIIGISFSNSLIFDSYIGSVNVNGPGVFNNISYYKTNNLQQIQSNITRPWVKVKADGATTFDWQYWDTNYTWNGMLIISTSETYGVNPSEIYKTYIGTNKIIIDDGQGMTFDSNKIKVYKDASWSSSIVTPA
jgi:hypothetical protein